MLALPLGAYSTDSAGKLYLERYIFIWEHFICACPHIF